MAKVLRAAIPILDVCRDSPGVCGRRGTASVYRQRCSGSRAEVSAQCGPCRAGQTIRPRHRRFLPQVRRRMHFVRPCFVADGCYGQAYVCSLYADIRIRAQVKLNDGPRCLAGAAFGRYVQASGGTIIRRGYAGIQLRVTTALLTSCANERLLFSRAGGRVQRGEKAAGSDQVREDRGDAPKITERPLHEHPLTNQVPNWEDSWRSVRK